jgi:hypothetical protein
MRNRLISTVVLAFLSVSAASAQEPQPTSQQQEDARQVRQERAGLFVRIRQRLSTPQSTEAPLAETREAATCAGPDDSRVPLNAEIFFDGRVYRCVEVFERNDAPGMANAPLKQRNVGLVRTQAQ